MNNENVLKKVMRLSVVAALYVALTFALSFIAYGNVQFRVAEILVLLCFFKKDYSISLIIGCAIVNLFSPLGILDVAIGTLATTLSVICIMYSKRLYVSIIYPVLFNALLVGGLLIFVYDTPFILNILSVGFGELVVMIFGVIMFKYLRQNNHFISLIKADQNI